jgi:CRISPR-associated endonuclease/helicase Cas3
VLTFPDSEQKVTSRLGAADNLLTFDAPLPGPFGQAIQHLPVRHHLWPKGVSPDEPPRNLSPLTGGGFTFLLGDTTYRYSRLGLERLQTQEAGVTP